MVTPERLRHVNRRHDAFMGQKQAGRHAHGLAIGLDVFNLLQTILAQGANSRDTAHAFDSGGLKFPHPGQPLEEVLGAGHGRTDPGQRTAPAASGRRIQPPGDLASSSDQLSHVKQG